MTQTIIINSEFMGNGSEELGRQLIASFFRKLWGLDNKPAKIVFYNSGVKLLALGSPVLESLEALSQAGVDLIACGTCVTHFDLKGKIIIGRVSDMTEIASVIVSTDNAITI